MVLKRISANIGLFALGLGSLSSGTVFAKPLQDRLGEAHERLLSHNGIELSGAIQSEYSQSKVSGKSSVDTNFSYEKTQFTALDLTMQYRAYDFANARVDLRFLQDWQTFFIGTRSRVIAARWLSMDGNIANTLSYNVGDFRQKYTPLTVWAPELDLVYEPTIFSQRRAQLMEEQYLGNNNRNLQGANVNLARKFDSPLSEVRLDAMGSRVRRAEFLDANGAHGLNWDRSDMDRFLFAGNGEVLGWQNILLGGTVLRLADDEKSYRQSLISADTRENMLNFVNANDTAILIQDGESLNGRNSVVARNITVMGGHGGVDIGGFLGNPQLILDFTWDFAQSKETNKLAWAFKRDSATQQIVPMEASLPDSKGKAYHLELAAGWQGEDSAYGFRLTGRFMNNEAKFSNPIAQSPTFLPARILNTENDLGSGALYSTFDALNNGVYKFSPSRQTQANQQAPFTKIAYNNGILSPEDLQGLALDPVVQLTLPAGLATSNRKGPSVRVEAHLRNSIHATVDADILQEAEGLRNDSVIFEAAKITRMGGGLKVEVADMLGFTLPLDISGSYFQSKYSRAQHPTETIAPDITTDLLLAGFNYRFFPKWALLGGLEYSKTTLPGSFFTGTTPSDFQTKITQTHFRVGVEFLVTQSAYLLLSGGMNKVTSTRTPAPADPQANGDLGFSQALAQALINVKF